MRQPSASNPAPERFAILSAFPFPLASTASDPLSIMVVSASRNSSVRRRAEMITCFIKNCS